MEYGSWDLRKSAPEIEFIVDPRAAAAKMRALSWIRKSKLN